MCRLHCVNYTSHFVIRSAPKSVFRIATEKGVDPKRHPARQPGRHAPYRVPGTTAYPLPPMTALQLLDHIAALGVARARPAPPGTDRALAVGPIEVARAERASDTFMRARWRERIGTGGGAYLLIADEGAKRAASAS